MIYPDVETMGIYAEQYTYIPMYKKTKMPKGDIPQVYERFRGPYTFLLESGETTTNGRYTIIGMKTMKRFVADAKGADVYSEQGHERKDGNPMELLKEMMDVTSCVYPELSVFTGGAIGHFNYDVVRLMEDIPDKQKEELHLPLMQFAFVKELLVFDHKEQQAYVIVNILAQHTHEEYEAVKQRIEELDEQLHRPYTKSIAYPQKHYSVHSNVTKDEYIDMVKQAKEYIASGDIFQVVLSQRFQCTYEEDPFAAYCAMRKAGCSPYMYYLDFASYVIAGMSPEMLLKCRGSKLMTMPIAGTRKRGKDALEDVVLMHDLAHDHKELCEHMMLVDLGRNDIGKVAEIGSVEVHDIANIEKYSHVMHMTSKVTGTLRKDKHVLDAFASLLPAGTLSGAPKIRAMEIIDELESVRREVYGGAIAFLGYNGHFDTCIAIRTFIFHKMQAYIQAGAGIVKDSDPQKEYQETLQKAAALLHAIGQEVVL